MKTNLLSRIGRAAIVAFIGALSMFATELAGILPELSGMGTIVVTGLIGLVSYFVEGLRDSYNIAKGFKSFTVNDVKLTHRIGRALATALVGGIVVLAAEVSALLPEISGLMQVAVAAAAGGLSLLVEYLRDYFELPALT